VEAEVRTWLAPLLDTLALLHGAGHDARRGRTRGASSCCRRGPVLLGPDAARRAALAALGTPDLALAPGYAAIEQYRASTDAGDVGPWTDLHAVGALLCRAFTGAPPPPAPERIPHDPFLPLSARNLEGVRETMLAAVDAAIAPRPAQRPRHHAELRGLIGDLESPRPPPVLVPRADPMEEPFLGARLRPEETTIPDLPLVERSAEIAEAISAVSRPQPLAADGPATRRNAPRLAAHGGAPRSDGTDAAAASAVSAPLPWLDQPDPRPSGAAPGGGSACCSRRSRSSPSSSASSSSCHSPAAPSRWRGRPHPRRRLPAGVASPANAASVAVPVVAGADGRPAAAPSPPEPASPSPAATPVPAPVVAGESVPIRAERQARCTEILQKASLEGIGAADAEFYKRECR
jgi:hypothetical protein